MTPVSQAVHDRAARLAQVHPLSTVAELIGKDLAFVSRMRARGWRSASYPRRPRPSDFSIQAAHMGVKQLEKHYRAGAAVVSRWRREAGLA
jgi:hypothetical protein